MLRTTKFYVILFLAIGIFSASAQELTEIKGKLIAIDDVEGIHVLNITSNKYTVSDDTGLFTIPAKLRDTLIMSSIKYKQITLTVDAPMIFSKSLAVEMQEMVNTLDQVVIGKILTGDLNSDIENSDAEPELNFYDLGIPGYTGPRKTQTQRRLFEASTGSGFLPLNPLINAITGRTKRLKELVALETLDSHLRLAEAKFKKLIFNDNTEAFIISRFFQYVGDDNRFLAISFRKNDMELLEFLMQKKIEFFALNTTKNED